MNMHRATRVLAIACLLVSSLQSPHATGSQEVYPAKPIRIVVPWSAGGFTDRLARSLASSMAIGLQQPVIVENRTGAAGAIGSEYVARAPADGYTLLLTTTDAFVKMLQDKKVDPERDYSQIALLTKQPVFLAVGPRLKTGTVRDFVHAARSRPAEISYASPGEGSAIHLAMEGIADQLGLRLIHVPYKGLAPGLTDLIGGQVDSTLISMLGASKNFEAGKIRPLAITSVNRSALLPDVPTLSESVVPGYQLSLWYGLAGPKGLPRETVERLVKSARAALASREIRAMLEEGGAEHVDGASSDLEALMRSEATRWRRLIR